MLRAGHSVRSASAPDSAVNLLIALEASEALRAAHLMGPRPASAPLTCLLCDLVVASSAVNTTPLPGAAQIRSQLEQRGVRVITLQVDAWLQERRLSDVLVSGIVFGAIAALFELPTDRCEALLLQGLAGARRDQNLEAFRWGQAQLQAPLPMPLRLAVAGAAPIAAVPATAHLVRMPALVAAAA